jgi:preprotein translocase SecE subunit
VNNNGNLITIAVWGVVILALFGLLWWKGYIVRLRKYCEETWAELKPGRCSWPTWTELRGSTALIGVTIFLLGAFISVLDFVFNKVFTKVL